jgi:hypothetical protein
LICQKSSFTTGKIRLFWQIRLAGALPQHFSEVPPALFTKAFFVIYTTRLISFYIEL